MRRPSFRQRRCCRRPSAAAPASGQARARCRARGVRAAPARDAAATATVFTSSERRRRQSCTRSAKRWPPRSARSRRHASITRCTTPPPVTGASPRGRASPRPACACYDASFAAGLLEAAAQVVVERHRRGADRLRPALSRAAARAAPRWRELRHGPGLARSPAAAPSRPWR